MKLIIKNGTADSFSFADDAVVVAANTNIEVPLADWESLFDDVEFTRNIRNNNLTLNDGVQDYSYPESENFVRLLSELKVPTPVETSARGVTVEGSGTTSNTTLITVDTLGFSSGFILIENPSGSASGESGTVAFESSNDNTTWSQVSVVIDADPGGNQLAITGFRTEEQPLFIDDSPFGYPFRGPFNYRVSFTERYFRIVLLAAGTGNPTIRATLHMHAVPIVPPVLNTRSQIVDYENRSAVIGSTGTDEDALNVRFPSDMAPLPVEATIDTTGLATDACDTSLASIDAKTPTLVGGRQPVDGSGVIQPISAASLPLPTGAATEAKQDTEIASLGSIDTKLSSQATAANQTTEITALQLIDDAIHAPNAALSKVVAIGGQMDDTSTAVATEGNVSAARLTEQRAFHTNLRNIAGTEVGTAAAPLRTDPTGSTTQPISAATLPLPAGAATEATLSALNTKTPALGQATMANSSPMTIASDQSAIPVKEADIIFRGRTSSFNTPGRAGTGGQKILAIYNTSGSGRTVKVEKVIVDLAVTVIKAVTVPPPIVRLWKFTAVQTNGTALTKNKIGGTGATSASVVVHGDASADGTGSGTTLTVTLPAGTILTQEYAGRLITAAGYEAADRIELVDYATPFTLEEGEGICVFLDYTAATQNPTTDRWLVGVQWTES